MQKFRAAMVGLLLLAGCTTNTNPGTINFTTQPTIQLSVGTINDTAHVLSTQMGGFAASTVYLNAIGTFRNQFGNSAFGASGATATSPGQAALAPIPAESCNFTTGAGCNIGWPQVVGTGLFAYGQGSSLFGSPCTLNKVCINGLNSALPAWGAQGAGTGFLNDSVCGADGCPGFGDMFPLGAGGTQYTLKDQLVVNGATLTYSASATLNAVPTVLAAAPNAVYAPVAGSGGGTFTFGAAPAGATEQVVMVLSGPPAPFVTIVVASAEVCTAGCPNAGTLTAVLPANTLDTNPLTLPHIYQCFVMAADFPWVEAGQVTAPVVGIPNPVIVGANGNADLSAGNTYPCTQT